MNRKIKLLSVVLFAAMSVVSAQTKKAVWPQMKAFHAIMSATFHPAEEGNFAPLKAKADSLVIVAKQWQAAPVASDFKPAETKAALEKLVKQCVIVNDAVKENAGNEKLKKLITEAHDVFHTIAGECRKEE